MFLLILASLALADPWSRGAAAQLAESVGDLDGAVVEITVTGAAPTWLEPAAFTATLAEQAGAESIRPARSGPPWPELALSLALSAEGEALAVDWRLARIGEGAVALRQGRASLRGPSPPDPMADFTGRADWPEIAALLSARHAAGLIAIDGASSGTRREKDAALIADLKARSEAVADVEARWRVLLEDADTDLRILGLVELGVLLDSMAEAILVSAIPDYLTGEQVELYRMALQDKAYPMQEKGAGFSQEALAEAWRSQRYLPCIQVAIDRSLARRELRVLVEALPLWVQTGDVRDDAEALAARGHWHAAHRLAGDIPRNRGIIALMVHDAAGARAAFTEALAADPDDLESSLGLAVAMRHAGETGAAILLLESLPQTQAVLWNQISLHEAAGDVSAARKKTRAFSRLLEQGEVLEPRIQQTAAMQRERSQQHPAPSPPPPPPSPPAVLLAPLRDTLAEMDAFAARCALSEADQELYAVVREQVVLVLEAEEVELVQDVSTFVDEVFLNVADCSPK